MKHYLNLILLLFSISLSAQQQSDTLSHKHQMIDAINRGDYNQATQELVLVTDWGDDVYLNVDSVITFISQVKENKLSISQKLIDSLSNYAYLSLQKSLYQEIDTAKHAEARLKYELLLNYNKLLLGEHNQKQAIILRNIGYCYNQEKNLEMAEQYFINAFNHLPKNPATEEYVENYVFVLNWLYKYYYEEKEDTTMYQQCLLRAAEKHPFLYPKIAKIYEERYGRDDDFTNIRKAMEYYYKADSYGMLNPRQANSLWSIYDYFGQKGLLDYDEIEVERLKKIIKTN